MCGIVGCTGQEQARHFVVEGLKRLEYRGHDSWGVLLGDSRGNFARRVGLGAPSRSPALASFTLEGGNACLALGHTRWASHGGISENNAHPIECRRAERRVWVAHNGTVSNFAQLWQELVARGCVFHSDTDSEVIAQLFGYYLGRGDPLWVVGNVLDCLRGDNAFAVVSSDRPGLVMLAARGSPLVVSPDGCFASDPIALAGHASRCHRLLRGEMALLQPGKVELYDEHGRLLSVDYDEEVPQLSGDSGRFASCMLAEIHEQPELARRLASRQPPLLSTGAAPLGRVVLFGCGSSYNAALLGRHYFQGIAGWPAQAEYATEMMVIDQHDTLYLALTQSGETRDTINALEKLHDARKEGRVAVLTASPASSAARLAKVVSLDCGPERGVAATKTFLAQALLLYRLAGSLAGHCSGSEALADGIAGALASGDVLRWAEHLLRWHNILYLGSGPNYPVAREGALKMKEVAYRHAEAMPASEVKHGPLALVDDDTLCLFLLDDADERRIVRTLNNINEVRARRGAVLVVADEMTAGMAMAPAGGNVLSVPHIGCPYLQPLVHNVALQLLAYHVAVLCGNDVDRPRHLAKSVTVE